MYFGEGSNMGTGNQQQGLERAGLIFTFLKKYFFYQRNLP